MLVPSVGTFFTPLLLTDAFAYQDERRRISSRRFVPPSFNDIRLTLNSAQIMSLVRQGPLELVTFDGDLTLYDDGDSLGPNNPVISRIIRLLARGVKVAIVTAAGYTEPSNYYGRLRGLLENMKHATETGRLKDPTLVIMGGESSYLFEFRLGNTHLLEYVPRERWLLDAMRLWTEEDIMALLDVAEAALRECVETLDLSAEIVRKERAVGIVPLTGPGARKFTREQLEETVLVTQQVVEMSAAGKRIPFCAFNGWWYNSTLLPEADDTQVAMTSSWTLAISPGVSWHANAISEVSKEVKPSMLATSSCPPERMISRPD